MEAETIEKPEVQESGNRIVGVYDPSAEREAPEETTEEAEVTPPVEPEKEKGAEAEVTPPVTPGVPKVEPTTGPDVPPVVVPATPPPTVAESWQHADLKDDETANKMLEAYKAGPEEFSKFLAVVSTDWAKMPDEEVLKYDLRQQYPKLSEKAFELLYSEELEKFNIGSTFSEEQEEVGRAKMQRAADVVRNAQLAIQQAYQVPDRSQPSAEQLAQQKAQQIEQEESFKALEQLVTTNPVYRDFETKRGITLGDGDEAFNLAADPSIKDIKADVLEGYGYDFLAKDKDGKEIKDAKGQPVYDVEKAMLVRLIAKDPKKFFANAVAHGRALEKKAIDAQLRNPGNGGGNAAPSGGGGDRIIGPVNIR